MLNNNYLSMQHAKEAANKSTGKWMLGAAIVKKNRVLATAHNVDKTHPVFGSGKYMNLHAEGHAIYKAIRRGIDVRGATMYVYRKNERLAKPCPCCMSLIHKYGIKEVIYTGN